MTRNSWIVLAILAVIASVFGIVTALNQSNTASAHFQGQWALIGASDASGDIDTTLTTTALTVDDSTLSGSVCNRFSADYSLTGTTLAVREVLTTEMWCDTPAGLMDAESRFVAALSRANTVRYEGTNLVLIGVDIRLVFAQSTPD
jgi:heat shock protein HslJ